MALPLMGLSVSVRGRRNDIRWPTLKLCHRLSLATVTADRGHCRGP